MLLLLGTVTKIHQNRFCQFTKQSELEGYTKQSELEG